MKQFGEGEGTVKKKKKRQISQFQKTPGDKSCGLKATHGLINALGEGANSKLLHTET